MRTPVSRIEKIGGLFIIIAVLVLGAVLVLPRMMSGRLFDLYHLRIIADHGIGLSAGDSVEIQGIQVGEVNRF